MGKKVSIGYYLQATAGASGDITVYQVEAGRKFKTASVYIFFPAGDYLELEVAIFRGIKQVAPYKGTYRGDNSVIEDEFIEDISSAERVIVHYVNNNADEERDAYILIRGELD